MSLFTSLRTGRVLVLALLSVVLFTGILLRQEPSTEWLRNQLSTGADKQVGGDTGDPRCVEFPDPGSIAIAVKTGATEATAKVPMQMATTLRCAQSVMIFSDLEQTIAGYQLHDALEDIPESAMEGNSDFEFYYKLKEAQRYGAIEKLLKDYHDPRITTDLAAWTLDKYKDLHILEKLYEAHPNKDWYLMIDADTYLVWSNLLKWLPQLPNPRRQKSYLGSPAKVGDVDFAHGGSGVFLSHAAMYDFAVTHNGTAASWDKPMHEECCGDLIVATVLKQNGILLKPSWPTINGEKPVTLPFGPTHWCQPVVTMHHVQTNEMNQLWNMESRRNDTQKPLTFIELYEAFTKDVIPSTLDEWDNACKDTIIEGMANYEDCQRACEDRSECFQFVFNGQQCALGDSVHLGSPRDSEEDLTWRSGWLKDRITKWVDSQPLCGQPKFPHT